MIIQDYQLNGRRTLARAVSSLAHLNSFFGDTPAWKAGRETGAYCAHRLAQGAAPGTVKVELAILGRGFSLALRDGLLRSRPSIASVRVSNVRKFMITEEMADAILAYLPPDERDVAEMAYLVGWRVSEITGLRWENVDRLARVVRLDPGTTKNGEGRVVPYGKFAQLASLIERRWTRTIESSARWGRIPFVFHRRGRQLPGIRYAWQHACDRAGLDPRPVFHDWRRVAARNMVRSGMPIKVAMAILGHKTRSMFDRYHIVVEEDLQEGLARYSVRLFNTRSNGRGKSRPSEQGIHNTRSNGRAISAREGRVQ